MSKSVDLSTYGSDIKKIYDAVVSSDPDVTWAVFGYKGATPALTPLETGSGSTGGLRDFVEEFDEAKVQYGLAQVDVGTTPKVILVGWIGEAAPERQRSNFTNHFAAVARYFTAHHIQITARSADDLTPASILKKVDSSAGSKYNVAAPATRPHYIAASEGANEDDWGDAKPVEEREELDLTSKSSYKPTKVEVSTSSRPHRIQGLDSKPASGSSKVDLEAIRREGRGSKFADARVEKIESSYKPVGKVDLGAIRAQAKKEQEIKDKNTPSVPAPKKQEDDDTSDKRSGAPVQEEEPALGSIKDRMAAFNSQVRSAKPEFEANKPTSGSFASAKRTFGRSSAGVDTSIPDTSAGSSSEFKNFGLKDGKSPAQLWAEKHGKFNSEPVKSTPQAETKVEEEETPREQVEKVNINDKDDEKPAPSFADLTKRFASTNGNDEAPPKSSVETREKSPSPPPAPPVKKETQKEPEHTKASEPEEDEGLTAVVEVEYQEDPSEDNEISLKVGETITNIDTVDENWWIGMNSQGKIGLFPAEYVKVRGGKGSGTGSGTHETPAPSEPAAPSLPDKNTGGGDVVIAEYEYDAEGDDELTFKEGDKITNVQYASEDWWSGELNGRAGLFPSNFVRKA